VLGMEWLAGLREIEVDFEKLTLTVPVQNKKVTLRAEPELIKAAIRMKIIEGTMLESELGFMVELKKVEREKCVEAVLDQVVQLLTQFERVFQKPQGLLPDRERDHAITTQEGTRIPNLRPYKYQHYQKDEIEKMVRDMLTARIIRTSSSPYASLVILVKKKNGSWRFCVDYRALNKITVPKKFPIPIIKELLDEIGGTDWFSKLDLHSGCHQS